MHKFLIFIMVALFLVFAVSCDDEGTTELTDGSTAAWYYPGSVGSTFSYEGQYTDSSTTTTTYERNVSLTNEETVNSKTYITQTNTISAGVQVSASEFLFRTTTTGMFIYSDLSSLEEILDSLINTSDVDVESDQEMQMLSYPFDSNSDWDVFSLSLSTLGGLVTVDVISIKGYYQGQENLTVMNQSMTAEKMKYVASIKIPNESLTSVETYSISAYAWFVKDVGLVKMSGDGSLINALVSGEVDIDVDDETITEVIQSYNIVE